MALQYASMMNMTRADLIGMSGDLQIYYYMAKPGKGKICIDIQEKLGYKKEPLHQWDVGHMINDIVYISGLCCLFQH